MLFLVEGNFSREQWESCRKPLQQRRKRADVKVILEMMVPGSYGFTGVYESKDATNLYKYLSRLQGLEVRAVMPALHLDNVLIIDEASEKKT